MRNYYADEEVREDFDRALGAVKAYLGSGSGTTSAQQPPASEADVEAPPPLDQMEQDDLWGALAKARRDLEKTLRRVLSEELTESRPTLGKLLAIARERRLITDAQGRRLTEAVQLANMVIHGDSADPSRVSGAISTLTEIAARIANQGPPPDPVSRADRSVHVVQNADGKWRVMKSGAAVRSGTFTTQREAADRARDLAYRARGGEVVIHGRDGRIFAKDTVASKKDVR